MSRTIVIAGAAGNIGTKLTRHFAELGWQLRLLDLAEGEGILACDLSVWDEGWARHFVGADAVVLLAGDPSPQASWESVQRLNLDLPLNVYEAAARARVKRLVFASSNWTMAGHRFSDVQLTTDLPPHPVNAYGMSKLAGERMGRAFSEHRGLSVICFRIGYCQRGENLPGLHMRWGDWGQAMWLSDRDLAQGFEKALSAPDDVRFAVLNLMSANVGMRWDIATTERVIGFVPADASTPVRAAEHADRADRTRHAHATIAAAERWLLDTRW